MKELNAWKRHALYGANIGLRLTELVFTDNGAGGGLNPYRKVTKLHLGTVENVAAVPWLPVEARPFGQVGCSCYFCAYQGTGYDEVLVDLFHKSCTILARTDEFTEGDVPVGGRGFIDDFLFVVGSRENQESMNALRGLVDRVSVIDLKDDSGPWVEMSGTWHGVLMSESGLLARKELTDWLGSFNEEVFRVPDKRLGEWVEAYGSDFLFSYLYGDESLHSPANAIGVLFMLVVLTYSHQFGCRERLQELFGSHLELPGNQKMEEGV